MATTHKHLFLDRDGVINTIKNGFANSVEKFVFADGALQALKMLAERFQPIVVVTNQAGIGYGYMKAQQLEAIHTHMVEEVQKAGGRIDGVYYCPDRVSAASPCRKPNVGMAIRAKTEFPEIDFKNSFMVGDRDSDIEFGNRLNMKTVRITSSDHWENEVEKNKPNLYFSTLLEFAKFVSS